MGDPQQNKEKNPYSQWSPEETSVLIELLVEGIKRGWRDASGSMNKATVENKILPVLNERLGCQRTYKHYQSKIKYLKSQYQNYVELQNNTSGFGWDPVTKKITASDEVWNGYLKAHPSHKYMRYDSHDQFENLEKIFGCTTANGSNSVGLGDTTDARTFQVDDNQVNENWTINESGDEVDDLPLLVERNQIGRVEKLVPRKRSRPEATNNAEEVKSGNNDSMIEVSNKILSIIQQREERQQKEAEKREEKLKLEAEQREAEKKKNSVWDAMKEIPNLDQRTKFKAVTLIYSLGMKNVFADMSVEERFGWIQANISSE